MNHFTRFLGSILLVLLLNSCQDHLIQTPTTRFRLTKIIQTTSQQYASITFTYDSDNKITSFVQRGGSDPSAENSAGLLTVVTYDAQGRVSSTEEQPAGTQVLVFYKRVYEYDANGRVSIIRRFVTTLGNPFNNLDVIYGVRYNSTGLPIGSNLNGGSRLNVIENYTYDGGNIVSTERINGFYRTVSTYQYDNMPNPLYNSAGLLAFDNFLIYDSPLGYADILSKNNRIYPTSRQVYNSNGLLASQTFNVTSDPQEQITRSYTYEAI